MLDALAADPNFSLMAERILGMKDELPEVKATTQYKPEYSWNYEIGSHLTLWEGKLWAESKCKLRIYVCHLYRLCNKAKRQ